MLKAILETGLKMKAIKHSDLANLNVETTVQTNAIRYPTSHRWAPERSSP
jgi:hypothetical protein